MARFSEEVTEYKMCVWFSGPLYSEILVVLRRNERDVIKNVYWSSRKAAVILVKF
jgi:hypothetical protein